MSLSLVFKERQENLTRHKVRMDPDACINDISVLRKIGASWEEEGSEGVCGARCQTVHHLQALSIPLFREMLLLSGLIVQPSHTDSSTIKLSWN